MTKAAAIYQFFSGFKLDAYEENSVYSLENAPDFPYITYQLETGSFDGNDITISASLWYRSTSWGAANAKVEEISAEIGRSGKVIPIDGGFLLVMRGSPFAQSLGDPSDDMVKRKLLSFVMRFYTND